MSDALENAVTVQLKMQDRISELEAALNKSEAERDAAVKEWNDLLVEYGKLRNERDAMLGQRRTPGAVEVCETCGKRIPLTEHCSGKTIYGPTDLYVGEHITCPCPIRAQDMESAVKSIAR